MWKETPICNSSSYIIRWCSSANSTRVSLHYATLHSILIERTKTVCIITGRVRNLNVAFCNRARPCPLSGTRCGIPGVCSLIARCTFILEKLTVGQLVKRFRPSGIRMFTHTQACKPHSVTPRTPAPSEILPVRTHTSNDLLCGEKSVLYKCYEHNAEENILLQTINMIKYRKVKK